MATIDSALAEMAGGEDQRQFNETSAYSKITFN